MKRIGLVISILGLVFSSCLKDKTISPVEEPEGPCADTVSFNETILPEIFNLSCNTSGCHDAGSGAAGYVLETHLQITDNIEVVEQVIKHEAGVVPMPYFSDKLVDSLIQKFDCWIEQGALDN